MSAANQIRQSGSEEGERRKPMRRTYLYQIRISDFPISSLSKPRRVGAQHRWE